MKPDTLTVLRDPRLLKARETWFARMRGLFVGEHQEQAFVLRGIAEYTEDDGPDWERWPRQSSGLKARIVALAKDQMQMWQALLAGLE